MKKTGRMVAETIHACTGAGRDQAAAAWQQRFDRTLSMELRAALALRQALVSTGAKNLANRIVLARMPRVRARLQGAIFGETGYREAWSPAR